MFWPKLVGSVVIRKRSPRYRNEPSYKRLDFIRERNPPDLDEWEVVPTAEAWRVDIVQEDGEVYPELPPAPPLYIQQPECYDPWYHRHQQHQQYQQYQQPQYHQPQRDYQHYYQHQQPDVPPPPPHHPPYPGIHYQRQVTYHDPFQRRIGYPDHQANINHMDDYGQIVAQTRLISGKNKRSKSTTRKLIRGDSMYASDDSSCRGGRHY